ncbi:MAG: bis(5-nucleosidyl)-tetraphosphatase [Patescibacteria group bacterium]|nr:NUDIX hydrolase [Candidatus Saccharibacteria bacterium]MDQ5963006.1 bis(5-nucleosidyl)-tetraphosphatase [Patescibacteria group bacterium]
MESEITTIDYVTKVIVVNPEGQVLLLRRHAGDENRAGDWDFPGGGVDVGEEYVAAVRREALEESGIEIEPAKLVLAYANSEHDQRRSKIIHRFVYVAKLAVETDVVLSFEHDAYEWMTVEEALLAFPHRVYCTGLRFAQESGLLTDQQP